MTERELLSHLAVAFDAFTSAWRSPFRSEQRRDEVHVLEYTRFPRVAADVRAAIAAHFALNTAHFLGFSYPLLLRS